MSNAKYQAQLVAMVKKICDAHHEFDGYVPSQMIEAASLLIDLIEMSESKAEGAPC
jgi:hypothetical protein